jgi:chromate transporter
VNIGFQMGWVEWLELFGRFLYLSLLSIGGTVTVLPEMHRFLVHEHGWITDQQFANSVTLAQVAPGPNVLFIALFGWNVGVNSGSVAAGVLGMVVTMVGILLPSCTATYLLAGWGHRNRERLQVRAFKQGMAPIVVALMISTSWIMASAHSDAEEHWPLWIMTAVAAFLMWKTKIHLLWMMAAGAALGFYGLI